MDLPQKIDFCHWIYFKIKMKFSIMDFFSKSDHDLVMFTEEILSFSFYAALLHFFENLIGV